VTPITLKSGSTARQREKKKRFRRLLENVRRVELIGAGLVRPLLASGDLALVGIGTDLKHYIPLVRTVCRTAERAGLKGETVPASERIFSIFEDHAELIKRGKSRKPVEFGHSVWLAQSPSKFITDYEVMEEKIPDADLLPEIVARHKLSYKVYPKVVAADTGFRADAEEMEALEKIIDNVAVPGRGLSRKKIETWLHHFRAGIEGSISVLKRAFRLMICMYRGFKSFASAVGMAVFCHNLVNLTPRRAPA
jgi:transposase, IS5 family